MVKNIINTGFNNFTRQYLKELYNKLEKEYVNQVKDYSKNEIKLQERKGKYTNDDIQDLIDESDFISPDIFEEIKKYSTTHYYQYKNINLYFKTKGKDYKSNIHKLDIQNILLTASTISKFLKNNKFLKDDEIVNLIVIPTALQKKMPIKKNQIIGPHHCNSGCTIFYNRGEKVIIIWRREELLKVLIHELIHYHRLDKYLYPRDYQEAYTEILANVLHQNMLLLRRNTVKNSVSLINKHLLHESQFSQYQLAKLLNYWYPQNQIYDIMSEKHPVPLDLHTKISTDTNLFGYYWIKSALLTNLDDVCQFWHNNGYQSDSNNAKKIIILANKSLRNQLFHKNLEYWLKNINNPPKNNWKKTLRMTIID